jgi:hypothetical protein
LHGKRAICLVLSPPVMFYRPASEASAEACALRNEAGIACDPVGGGE